MKFFTVITLAMPFLVAALPENQSANEAAQFPRHFKNEWRRDYDNCVRESETSWRRGRRWDAGCDGLSPTNETCQNHQC